jgi:hypothetical protein
MVLIAFGCQNSEVHPKKARSEFNKNDLELLYQQADLVNEAIKKYNPEIFELPDDEYALRVRRDAFSFLLNREQSEFEDFFRITYGPFTDDLIPESVTSVFWEEDPKAEHYYLWTNFWKRFPAMEREDTPCMDAYVIPVVDGKIVRIKGHPMLPY